MSYSWPEGHIACSQCRRPMPPTSPVCRYCHEPNKLVAEMERYKDVMLAILAAVGFTEASTFEEFCRGLGDRCPVKGNVAGWRDIWNMVALLQEIGWLVVEKDGRLTKSLQLTQAGADHIRAALDEQRGLLGLMS